MVIKLGKLFESLKRAPLFKSAGSASGKETDTDVVEAEDVRVTEISLEDPADERDKELAEAREQLRQLSNTVYNTEDGKDEARVKDALAQLLKSESGLTQTAKVSPVMPDEVKAKDALFPPIQPEKELALQTMKVSIETTDGLQVSSAPAEEPIAASKLPDGVKAQGILNTVSATEQKKTKSEEAGDMISQIFNREDDTSNPLAGLLSSLPDASAQDLLAETRELQAMLAEWQHG